MGGGEFCKAMDRNSLTYYLRQHSFLTAFNVSTADPFIDDSFPYYCQWYAWSGTFTGNMIGKFLAALVFTGVPLFLGANPKFFMLDV